MRTEESSFTDSIWILYHRIDDVTKMVHSYVTQNPFDVPMQGVVYVELLSENDPRFWAGNFEFR